MAEHLGICLERRLPKLSAFVLVKHKKKKKLEITSPKFNKAVQI